MGHVVLTTAAGRVELNLDAEQEAAFARLLLAMIAAPALPVPAHTTSVEEAEAAQVSDPEPGTTVHGSGGVKCPECDRTFKTHQGLGGHMNAHTKDRLAGRGPRRSGRRFGTAEARGFHQEEEGCGYECPCGERFASAQAHAIHQTRKHLKLAKGARSGARDVAQTARKATSPLTDRAGTNGPVKSHVAASNIGRRDSTPSADRPFVCKEPGCGHPCRSRGELEKHREAYHDAKHPLPVTTQVLAAMSFPCPEDGCGRVYDDENRLVHHRRVTHDYQRVEPIHEVVVSTPAKAVKVG